LSSFASSAADSWSLNKISDPKITDILEEDFNSFSKLEFS
jgi:hypothetical protein